MNFVFRVKDDPRFTVSKRLRASQPKVKTGCKTCKKRRVKCDETKPACKKCIRFGTTCDGYEQDPPKPKSVTSNVRRLPLLTLENFPEASLFPSEIEFQYFRYFQEETVFELSESVGYSPAVWNRIILQACEYEPCLLHLITSVAAMGKATQEVDSPHHQYAIQQYTRALKGVRQAISSGQKSGSTRIALIASLMILCFEVQHGDPDIAFNNLRSALRLLQERLPAFGTAYSHLQDKCPLPELEYELFAAFVRADYNLAAKSQLKGMDILNQNILQIAYVDAMPFHSGHLDAFRDIFEARNHFEHLRHMFLKNKPSNWTSFSIPQPHLVEGPVNFRYPFYDKLDAEIQGWYAAFAPLVARSSTSDADDYVQVTVLQVQGLCLHLLLSTLAFPDNESKTYKLFSLSRDIVALCKPLVADARFHKKFSFETGIIRSLFTVVFACRELGLRREAIAVLRSIVPRRECVWDSGECVRQGERILEVEELRRIGGAGDEGEKVGIPKNREDGHATAHS